MTTFTTAGLHAISAILSVTTPASAAVDAGTRHHHHSNAMPSIHHQRSVPPMLTDSRVVCELIYDGIAAPDVIRIAMATPARGAW